MTIYEYGKEHPQKFLFIATAAMEPYWAFEDPIRFMAEKYHVYAVAADGHDPEHPGDFISIEKTVADMDQELRKRGVDAFYGAYGLSMGGSVLTRFVVTSAISVEKMVLDAAIMPYTYPKWICKWILFKDFVFARAIVRNRKLLELIMPPEKGTPEGHDPKAEYDKLEEFYKTYSDQTIKNLFWSTNNYLLPQPAPPINTRLEYWFGEKEKRARKKDMVYIKNYFSNICMREIKGLGHGELLMIHPKKWADRAMEFFAS